LFLKFQQNYFNDSTKLFFVSSEILDPSAKSFFPCRICEKSQQYRGKC